MHAERMWPGKTDTEKQYKLNIIKSRKDRRKMSGVNSKIERIQKTSKVVLTVANIMKVFFIAAAAVCIAAGIAAVVFGEEMNDRLVWATENGFLRIGGIYGDDGLESDLTAAVIQGRHMSEVVSGYMLAAGGMLAAMAVMLHFIGRIFRDFRESYSPFQPGLVKELKIVFVLIAVFSFKTSLLVGFLVSLALWCVIQIFDYGCELQRESDETL